MQFHHDGFRPGDPTIADPVAALPPPAPPRPLPAEVDVLVVGSGPAGLTLAAQLAAFPDLNVCLAEAKPGPLRLGQADGIACRTMEMFEAFGVAHLIEREAYQVNEVVFWKPDPLDPERIRRSDRIPDVEEGLSEMPHVILNQARVHDRFLELMRHAPTPLVPHYSRRFVGLEAPDGPDEPVIAHFDCLDRDGATETVRARYLVGCDGARSQVRAAIGRRLVGDAANQVWGVMDVLAVTDFPDIRYKAVVHSQREGNLLVIPREGGHLVRLYIELDELDEGERAADRGITVERLIDAAQRILRPYEIAVHEVAWWSAYEIGQRICDKYDDVPAGDEAVRSPRVFIAGDACHTHSPKAGQGMNVSMRDSFNLGWKLAAVLRNRCGPELLHTYSAERQAVAQQLIDFDRELAAMFSAPPKASPDDDVGVDPAVFQEYFRRSGRFTAGVETRYESGPLVGSGDHQHLAEGFPIGMRFHSAPVVRVADGKPMHLGHVARADGRWRLYVFGDAAAGVAGGGRSALDEWCAWLEADRCSPVVRYTPHGDDRDAVFDVRAVVQRPHHDVTIHDVPSILRPARGRYGLVDHEKVFAPDPRHDVFDVRGVDRTVGVVVVVRPDQHVAQVLPLHAVDELAGFFDAFMTPA